MASSGSPQVDDESEEGRGTASEQSQASAVGLQTVVELLRASRPTQWAKNAVVLAPLVFAGRMFVGHDALLGLVGCALFCAASSGLYLVNDLCDLEEDRRHPQKRDRPLASGRLSPRVASSTAALLVLLSIAIGAAVYWRFGLMLVAYSALTAAYSLGLKSIVILDVFVVAAGFVLRAVAGAVMINVEISDWLLVCTLFLALFLAMCKRRHELVLLGESAHEHRAVLSKYTPYLLDQMIAAVAAGVMLSYTLYTVAPETVAKFATTNMKFTVPWVLIGIFRYLYLVHRKEEGGAPEKVLLTDVPLILTVAAWAITAAVVIYVLPASS